MIEEEFEREGKEVRKIGMENERGRWVSEERGEKEEERGREIERME